MAAMMNAATFYDLFKRGLRALDIDWSYMHVVEVRIEGDAFVMTYLALEFRIQLNTTE